MGNKSNPQFLPVIYSRLSTNSRKGSTECFPFCYPAASGQALFVDVIHLYDAHTCLGVEARGIGEAAAVHAQLNGGDVAGIELSEGMAKEGRAETFLAPRAAHA